MEYMLVLQKIRGFLNFEVTLIGHVWFGVTQSPKMHAEKKKNAIKTTSIFTLSSIAHGNQTIIVLLSQRNPFVYDFVNQTFQPGPFIQGATPSLLIVSSHNK